MSLQVSIWESEARSTIASGRHQTWAGQERMCEAIPGLAGRIAGSAAFQKSDVGPVSQEKKLGFEHVVSLTGCWTL